MIKRRPIDGRVVFSLAFLQQLLMSAPAMANDVHRGFSSAFQLPTHTASAFPAPTATTAPAASPAAANQLPAAFGHGFSQLPLASQTLPFSHMVNSGAASPLIHHVVTLPANAQTSLQSVQLDLTSADQSISLGAGMIKAGGEVTIMLGSTATTFHAGDKVTSAELVAIEQSQTRAGQTITLNSSGVAVGGTFSLNSVVAPSTGTAVTSIVVPNNVTAIDKVTTRNGLTLTGDLINYGSIVEVGRGGLASNLNAHDIVNESGASITTISKGLNLNLTALNELTNSGTITSAGALSLNAPSIINSGTASATGGDLTLTSGPGLNLAVVNNGGTLSASQSINIRQNGYAGNGTTSVTGGDLLSSQVKINAGQAIADVNVNQLTGTVVSVGEGVHVSANTSTLVLGSQCLTGDPTYYNTGGDIILTGAMSANESLTVISSKNIIAQAGLTQLTAHDAVNGKNITLIAGANISASPGGSGTSVGPVTIDLGSSGFGGDVDLTAASSNFALNASAVGNGGTGGSIVIAAYEGFSSGGHVLLPTGSTISAGGMSGGANGDITVLARAPGSGTAVQLGTIGASRNVFIGNLGISSSDGKPITFGVNGAITSSNTIVPSYNSSSNLGDVTLVSSTQSSGSLTIIAGGSLTSSGPLAAQGSTFLLANKDINFNVNLSGSSILAAAGSNVTATGSSTSISTSSNSKNAGNILISAGTSFIYDGVSVNFFSNFNGGNVNLANVKSINASSTASNGSGGGIVIGAAANGATGGVIDISNASVQVGGSGSGIAGDVTFAAGRNASDAVLMPLTLSFNGSSSSGGNLVVRTAQPVDVQAAVNPATAAFTLNDFSTGILTTGNINYGSGSQVNLNGGSLSYLGLGNITGTSSGIIGSTLGATLSGNAITLPTISLTGGAFTATARGNMTAAASSFVSASSVSLYSLGGSISVNNLTSNLQTVVVAASDVIVGDVSAKSSNGNGGCVTLLAGAQFSAGVFIEVDGAKTGNLTFKTINTSSTSAGTGGNVTLSAFSTDGSKGTITATGSGITAGGPLGNGTVIINSATGNGNGEAYASANPLTVQANSGSSGGSITLGNTANDFSSAILINSFTAQVAQGSLVTGQNLGAPATFSGLLTNGDIRITAGDVTLTSVVSSNVGTLYVTSSGNVVTPVLTPFTVKGESVAASGSISIGSSITAPNGISLVAGQDIKTTTNNLTISTGGFPTSGNITVIAGATFITNNTTIFVSGPSGKGGTIDFQTSPLQSLTTSVTGNAGSINLIAFASSDGTTGGVVKASSGLTLVSKSTSNGISGDVSVIAGGSGQAIVNSISVDASGALAGSGNVALVAAAPSSNSTTIARATGLVSGSFLGGASTTGSITYGTIKVNNASLRLQQGADFTVSTLPSSISSLILQSGGILTVSTPVTSNAVAMYAGKSLSLNSSVTSPGGIVMVAGGDITSKGNSLSTNVSSGNAGDITVIAGANFSTMAGGLGVNITGPSATSGSVNFSSGNISASSTGNTGGNITIASYFVSGTSTGVVLPLSGGTAVTVSSTGVNGGGNLTFVGGNVSMGSSDNTSGGNITGVAGSANPVSVSNVGVVTGSIAPTSNFNSDFVQGATISSGGGLVSLASNADVKATTVTTAGGAVSVFANGNVQVAAIDTSNTLGAGGNVSVSSKSTSNPLTIGNTTLNYIGSINTSGSTSLSTGTAGNLDLESTGGAGLTIAPGATITMNHFSSANAPNVTLFATGGKLDLGNFMGGSIDLSSTSGNGGTFYAVADTLVYANSGASPLTVDVSSGSGISGTVNINLTGSTALNIGTAAGNINFIAPGGSVVYRASNAPVTVDGSAIQVSSANSGGYLDIEAKGLSSSKNNVLDASAQTAQGGTIILNDYSANTLTIGGGAGQFALNAAGTSGGIISVTAQALVVDPSKISAAPISSSGDGATLSFNSNSTLVVNGNLSVDGGVSGNGGHLTLVSSSLTTFTTGATGKIANGVGNLSANGVGGKISITNKAGSIVNAAAITKFEFFSETVIGAKSAITINNVLGENNSQRIYLSSTGGNISSAKVVTTGILTAESNSGAVTFSKLNANEIAINTGALKTSNVSITTTGTQQLLVNGLAGYNIALKAAGNINVGSGGYIAASGTVAVSTTAKSGATITLNSITSPSTVTVSSTGGLTFGKLQGDKGIKLSNKDAGASINLNGDVISSAGTINVAAPGSVNINSSADLSAAKGVTLAAKTGGVSVGSVGAKAATSTLAVSGFTGVTVAGAVSTTGNITIKASDKTAGSGGIELDGAIIGSTKSALTLTAGALGMVTDGTAANGTTVSVGKIAVTAPGGATFNHLALSSTGSSIAITAAKGNVSIGSGASLNALTTAALTGLGDVTNAGSITGVSTVTLTSKGADNKTGTLTNSGSITGAGATGKVTLTTTGTLQQNGSITSNSDVTLKVSVGSLSTSSTSTTTSNLGKVVVTAPNNISALGSIKAKTNISLSTTVKSAANSLTVGDLTATEGNISVIGAGGSVSTVSGASLLADSNSSKTKATLLFEDSNLTDGTISIDGSLATHGPGGGNVSISIGAPGTGKNPVTTLSGFTIDTSKGGLVFAGATPTAIIVSGLGNATLTTEGKNIIMTSPSNSRTITFTNTSSVVADPPVGAVVVKGERLALPPVTAPNSVLLLSASAPTTAGASQSSSAVITAPALASPQDLTAAIANSRISDFPRYNQSTNNTYRWISPTELDGGSIPSVFISGGAQTLRNDSASTCNAAFEQSAERTTLSAGTALVAPERDLTIETPHGRVYVAARSLAIVMSLPDGLAVYNLHDTRSHAVAFEKDGIRTYLSPSHAAIFYKTQRASFADVNPAQLFCYGTVNESAASGGKMFTAEFSLPSAINAMPMLKGLIISKDSKNSRIAGDFLKTLSIMQQLTGARYQSFRQHIRPMLTASR